MISGMDFLCYSFGVLMLAVAVWIVLYLVFQVVEYIKENNSESSVKVRIIDNRGRN